MNMPSVLKTDWASLAMFGKSRIVRSSYFWLFAVPAIAKFLGKVEDILSFKINDQILSLTIALPFSWQIFYVSAVCFAIANLIFYIKCPRIVYDHKSPTDFMVAGKQSQELNDYAKEANVNHNVNNLEELYEGEELKRWINRHFWDIRNEAQCQYRFVRISCAIFFVLGLLLFALVLFQNFYYITLLIISQLTVYINS